MAKSAVSKAAAILSRKGAAARKRKRDSMTQEERTAQARAAANARWHPPAEQERQAS